MHIELSEQAVPEGSLELFWMIEDEYMSRYLELIDLYWWLEERAPGQFILISTGGWTFCPHYLEKGHKACCDYDTTLRLYLCPRTSWEEQKDIVQEQQREAEEAVCKLSGIPGEYRMHHLPASVKEHPRPSNEPKPDIEYLYKDIEF